MAQAIPRQPPAVVLRSRVNHLRAALAVATVALVGLTAAVAILATEDTVHTRSPAEKPLSPAPLPRTPYDGDPGIFGPAPRTPFDGDPGILGRPPARQFHGDPGILGPPPGAGSATEMKDEAGTAAAIGRSSGVTKFRGSKASEDGTSSLQPMSSARPQKALRADADSAAMGYR